LISLFQETKHKSTESRKPQKVPCKFGHIAKGPLQIWSNDFAKFLNFPLFNWRISVYLYYIYSFKTQLISARPAWLAFNGVWLRNTDKSGPLNFPNQFHLWPILKVYLHQEKCANFFWSYTPLGGGRGVWWFWPFFKGKICIVLLQEYFWFDPKNFLGGLYTPNGSTKKKKKIWARGTFRSGRAPNRSNLGSNMGAYCQVSPHRIFFFTIFFVSMGPQLAFKKKKKISFCLILELGLQM